MKQSLRATRDEGAFTGFVLFVAALVVSVAVTSQPASAAPPIDVWIDVDPGTGVGDVDDGLMLVQCLNSPELAIHGVSVVFGNAPRDHGMKIASYILQELFSSALVPVAGAASAAEFGKESDATRAMAAVLGERPVALLAVGPVTNVGTLVRLHPELQGRITRVVMVAGRRPGQRFIAEANQAMPFRDFNFELDVPAMQAILDTNIPLVFAPWEVSSHVWITRDDLTALAQANIAGRWIAHSSQSWMELWEKGISRRGFNPFDTLAAGWLTHPSLIRAYRAAVKIVEGPDDRAQSDSGATKHYLVAEPASANSAREIIYCFEPSAEFHNLLIERLAGPATP